MRIASKCALQLVYAYVGDDDECRRLREYEMMLKNKLQT